MIYDKFFHVFPQNKNLIDRYQTKNKILDYDMRFVIRNIWDVLLWNCLYSEKLDVALFHNFYFHFVSTKRLTFNGIIILDSRRLLFLHCYEFATHRKTYEKHPLG